MAIFIIVPAVVSIGGTFFIAGEGLSLGNYRDFFGNPQSTGNLIFTIEVTVVALACLLAIGLGIALYLRFSQSRLVAAIQKYARDLTRMFGGNADDPAHAGWGKPPAAPRKTKADELG